MPAGQIVIDQTSADPAFHQPGQPIRVEFSVSAGLRPGLVFPFIMYDISDILSSQKNNFFKNFPLLFANLPCSSGAMTAAGEDRGRFGGPRFSSEKTRFFRRRFSAPTLLFYPFYQIPRAQLRAHRARRRAEEPRFENHGLAVLMRFKGV